MRKTLYVLAIVLSFAIPAIAQDPSETRGPGAPSTQSPVPSCSQFTKYRDTLTGILWTSSGLPCTWTLGGQTFTPPVFANWSTLGAGCTNANTTTTGGAAAISVLGQAATTNTCGVKIAETGTFTRIAIINATVPINNFSGVLIGFTDGTKFESCGVAFNNALFTTSISSATLGGVIAAANGNAANGYTLNGQIYYFRLRSVAGTSLACDYSPDQGANWVNLFNDTTPFLTVSNVFFGANSRGAAGVPNGWLVSYQ